MEEIHWSLGKSLRMGIDALPTPQKGDAKIPHTKLISENPPDGREIDGASENPAFCRMGDPLFEKTIREAIDLELEHLKKNPKDCMVHINLMDAYFKGRNISPEYFDKSTYHAKQAIIFGHNTGYAEERLAKNLEKTKQFHQALQLYDIILENKEFHFSKHGIGKKIDFAKRRELVKKKLDKALDTVNDVLFTPKEIMQIIQSIRDNDAREEAERRTNGMYESESFNIHFH